LSQATEMEVRVARVLEPGAFATYDRGHTVSNYFDNRAFLNAEKVVKRALKKARAAISAMREPTFDMVKAGLFDTGPKPLASTLSDQMEREWRAMIDAATAPSQERTD
jgi:orotate phosphoribosyltransferase